MCVVRPIAATWVVLDIEGTVSSTATVQRTLFAYARARIRAFLVRQQAEDEVAALIEEVRGAAQLPATASAAEVAGVLEEWIDEDRKESALKTLQGLLWRDGFRSGELVGALFPDVAPPVRRWMSQGIRVAIFSSGSVQAQRDWFAHGPHADLSPAIDAYFDTVNAGPKREVTSYRRIARALGASAHELVFLSDVPAELAAAADAGWSTVGVARPGEPYADADFGSHRVITTFDELSLTPTCLAVAGDELAKTTVQLAQLGFMPATAGNVSAVVERSPLRLLVTASGIDKSAMQWWDAVVVDDVGAPITPLRTGIRPSAEAALHAHVAMAMNAGAVVHTHALSSVRAARRFPTGIRMPAVELLKALGHPADEECLLPVIENSQDMAVLAARWDDIRASTGTTVPTFVVADHGLYAWGATLDDARHAAEAVDWVLRLALDTD